MLEGEGVQAWSVGVAREAQLTVRYGLTLARRVSLDSFDDSCKGQVV